MQKIATKIFIIASIVFGVVGIAFVLSLPFGPGPDAAWSDASKILQKILMISVFAILTSFALSVAGKYLADKRST
jgi:hypothetical protein